MELGNRQLPKTSSLSLREYFYPTVQLPFSTCGHLCITETGNSDASSHVAVGLEEDRDVQSHHVLPEDVGDDLLHLSLVDGLVQVGDL